MDKLLPQKVDVRKVGVLPNNAFRVFNESWSNAFVLPKGLLSMMDSEDIVYEERKSVGEHATGYMSLLLV